MKLSILTRSRNYVASTVGIVALLAGCGSAEDQQIIKSFSYKFDGPRVDTLTEFSKNVPLNLEFQVPIKSYGSVRFIPGDQTLGFRIGTSLDIVAFLEAEVARLKRTRTLPNGQPFPSYVTTDLSQWQFNYQNINGSLYFGLESQARFLGTGVELPFVDNTFPEGLVISQKIADKSGKTLGVVTVYGPKKDNGRVVVPGGVFVVSNLTELMAKNPAAFGTLANSGAGSWSFDHGTLQAYQGFDVTGPNSDFYRRDDRLFQLFRQFRVNGKESGYMD